VSIEVIYREVASPEGDNLVVFYYLSASEILPGKRCSIIRGGLCTVPELL
jgi:hypothetical protein